jgi:hypothetical protein
MAGLLSNAENLSNTLSGWASSARAHPDEAIQQLDNIDNISKKWQDISKEFFNQRQLFKRHPLYVEELSSTITDEFHQQWRNFQLSMKNLQRGIEILSAAKKHEDSSLLNLSRSNIEPLIVDFQRATGALRGWVGESNRRNDEIRRSLAE